MTQPSDFSHKLRPELQPDSIPRDHRKQLGQWGEEQAAATLANLGYQIIARNWFRRKGELDIIAMDGGTIVFVEVRTRRPSSRFGSPEESVNLRKQRQLRELALLYLHTTRNHNKPCRFDVVSVYAGTAEESPVIRHIPNAF